MSDDGKMVKVFFSLEREDDWPPAGVESVWARSTGEPHHYIIENTPFFAREATLGDVVIANQRPTPDEPDAAELWFEERVKWGGNALIRLIIRRKEAEDQIVAWLDRAGCICEGFDKLAMVAASIPPTTEQAMVQQYLLEREQAGDVYVEEAILRA